MKATRISIGHDIAPGHWEASLGAIFACLMCVMPVVLVVDLFCKTRLDPELPWFCLFLTLIFVIELAFAIAVANALQRPGRPFAPQFATQFSKRWPLVLRPLMAAWWAVHFLFGIGTAVFFERSFLTGTAHWPVRIPEFVLLIVINFSIAYSSNLYALLAVSAIGFGRRVVDEMWRRRVLLDTAVVLVAALAPAISTWHSYQIAEHWFTKHF